MNKTCETCIFWERTRPGQFYGLCLNPKNYTVRKEFGDGCKSHEPLNTNTIEMQSNTRG